MILDAAWGRRYSIFNIRRRETRNWPPGFANYWHQCPFRWTSHGGLDHGTWSVLSKAYPEADVPVVQLSLDMSKPGAWHFEMGQKLSQLRDENILIIGSGNVVHNLAVMNWDETAQPYDWATRFNDFARDCISRNEPEKLFDYAALGDDAARSIPGADHYWPLLYALGARQDDDVVSFDPDFIQYKSLSMMSFILDNRQTS